MANNKKAYRELLTLRNQFLLHQIGVNEFLKKVESVLYRDVSTNAIKLAGGSTPAAYLTITRKLLADALGKKDNLRNLRIDLLAYELGYL